MRKIVRPPAPDFLSEEKQNDWGKQYRKNRETKGISYKFDWPQVNNQKLNHLLLPILRNISSKHCYYCDAYPIGSYKQEIDHFKPKSNPLFYDDVCRWKNLFLICGNCNSYKKEHFDEKLLKPDDLDYNFDDYFEYNSINGNIDVKPDISKEKQERAETTRKLLGFNEGDKPDDRKRSFREWHNDPDREEYFETYRFRFIFDKLRTNQP